MSHDYLSDRAANYKLMSNIRNWWQKRGYLVKVWVEKDKDPTNGTTMFVIRTNIVQKVSSAESGYALS